MELIACVGCGKKVLAPWTTRTWDLTAAFLPAGACGWWWYRIKDGWTCSDCAAPRLWREAAHLRAELDVERQRTRAALDHAGQVREDVRREYEGQLEEMRIVMDGLRLGAEMRLQDAHSRAAIGRRHAVALGFVAFAYAYREWQRIRDVEALEAAWRAVPVHIPIGPVHNHNPWFK